MLVIGFQEFVDLNAKNLVKDLLDDDKRRKECRARLEAALQQTHGESYVERLTGTGETLVESMNRTGTEFTETLETRGNAINDRFAETAGTFMDTLNSRGDEITASLSLTGGKLVDTITSRTDELLSTLDTRVSGLGA